MAHAAAFPLAPGLLDIFKTDSALRALRVLIKDETFVIDAQIPKSGSEASDFETVKRGLTADQPCYILYRSDDGEWTFMTFVPDDGKVKDKMLYSSAKDTLRKGLGGAEQLPQEVHWSCLSDVALVEQQSDTARAAEQMQLMTATERLKIEADRLEATEAAGDKLSSVVGLSFPLEPAAKEGLESFSSGSTAALVLAIAGETIVHKARAASAATSELSALVPEEPCYCLYRWQHTTRAGAAASTVLFMYICPEEAPVRAKMLHASTKASVLSSLPALGIEVGKSVEGVARSELTEKELMDQVYGAEVVAAAPATVTKAAPRGGRKLVKKRPDAAVDCD